MRKKITSWLLIMALVITMIPATAATVHAASGTYEGVKYDLTGGVLTIEKGNASSSYPAGSMGETEMYSYNGWKRYSNDVTKIVVKDGVTNIAPKAFDDMSKLVEVDIAGSVKQIGDNAFKNAPLLEDVNLENGVEKIGSYAFMYCSALADVELPSSIRWVGTDAFKYTALLDAQSGSDFITIGNVLLGTNKDCFEADDPCVIPSGITCVADSAFVDVEINGYLTFPDSLLYIGNYSFDGGNYNLLNCDKPLLELDLNNVVQIGNGAFRYWYCIDEVDLSKVTYVGDYAFYWCHDLHTLKFAPRMEYLGEYVISESNNVATVSGPEYVERAAAYAFSGQSPFSKSVYNDADGDGMIYYNGILLRAYSTSNEIAIADGTYNIASNAFGQYSPSDSSKVSVTIPESVTSIGYSLTFGNITDIYYGGSMKQWNAINFEKPNCFTKATIHYAKSDAETDTDVDVEVKDDCTVKGHSYGAYVTTTKATFGKAGVKTSTCAKCNATKTKSIAAVKAPKLSAATYTYNGKSKKPAVTVDGLAKANYTVTYPAGRTKVGTYKVTVNLTGADYTGTKVVTFKINPAKPSNVKLTAGKKQIKVSWKKPATAYRNQIDGYQIRYATSKNGLAKAKPVQIKGKIAINKTIKKLKSKKTYYVQVRTYNKIGSTTYYSAWTLQKSVKVK